MGVPEGSQEPRTRDGVSLGDIGNPSNFAGGEVTWLSVHRITAGLAFRPSRRDGAETMRGTYRLGGPAGRPRGRGAEPSGWGPQPIDNDLLRGGRRLGLRRLPYARNAPYCPRI